MSLAQLRRLRHQCVIATVDQADLAQRLPVLSDWPCSPLYPLGQKERERWSMATTTRAFRTYIMPPETTVSSRMRFLIDSADFRIVEVTPIPASGKPRLVELILDDEGL